MSSELLWNQASRILLQSNVGVRLMQPYKLQILHFRLIMQVTSGGADACQCCVFTPFQRWVLAALSSNNCATGQIPARVGHE